MNSTLVKVSYLSIDALVHRSVRMEGWLDAIGVPVSQRERFMGIDGADYLDVDALLKEAPAFFEVLRNHAWISRGTIAYYWGRYLLFDAVASMPAHTCAIVLDDDAQLLRPWNEYVQLAAELPAFEIVQLLQWGPSNPQHCETYEEECVPYLPVLQPCDGRSDFVVGTHYEGEMALLVTPVGARKLCTYYETHCGSPLEWAFLYEGLTNRGSAPWHLLSPLSQLSQRCLELMVQMVHIVRKLTRKRLRLRRTCNAYRCSHAVG